MTRETVNTPPALVRVLGWCAAVFLMAGALLPLIPQISSRGAPLTLEISGDFKRLRPEAIRAALSDALRADFYSLDLAAVKTAVESLPWVAGARVERVWPGTVRVQLREHRPYARWNEHALLSESGVVFIPGGPRAEEILLNLPQLAGPDGSQAEVRQVFEMLNEQLAGTTFVPHSLARDARGEWTAVTADGIKLKLGRTAPLETVARLRGPVRMALESRLQEVAYVDLHYINGFAVGWRDAGAGGAAGGLALAQGQHD